MQQLTLRQPDIPCMPKTCSQHLWSAASTFRVSVRSRVRHRPIIIIILCITYGALYQHVSRQRRRRCDHSRCGLLAHRYGHASVSRGPARYCRQPSAFARASAAGAGQQRRTTRAGGQLRRPAAPTTVGRRRRRRRRGPARRQRRRELRPAAFFCAAEGTASRGPRDPNAAPTKFSAANPFPTPGHRPLRPESRTARVPARRLRGMFLGARHVPTPPRCHSATPRPVSERPSPALALPDRRPNPPRLLPPA